MKPVLLLESQFSFAQLSAREPRTQLQTEFHRAGIPQTPEASFLPLTPGLRKTNPTKPSPFFHLSRT